MCPFEVTNVSRLGTRAPLRTNLIDNRMGSSADPLRAAGSSASTTKTLRRDDVVEWNSEAGRARGVILKKLVSNIRFKGYVHHASRADPQYLIKSVKTDHIAIHKGQALKRVRTTQR